MDCLLFLLLHRLLRGSLDPISLPKDMATPPDPVEGAVSSGTRMLLKVLKRCREEVKWPSVIIPVKKLVEMMVRCQYPEHCLASATQRSN